MCRDWGGGHHARVFYLKGGPACRETALCRPVQQSGDVLRAQTKTSSGHSHQIRGICSPPLSPVTTITCVNNNDSPATRFDVSGIHSSVYFRFWLFQGKEAMDIYSKLLDSEVNSLCALISVLK